MQRHNHKIPAPTESTLKVPISQTSMGYKCSCAKSDFIFMKTKTSDKKREKFNCMHLGEVNQLQMLRYLKRHLSVLSI